MDKQDVIEAFLAHSRSKIEIKEEQRVEDHSPCWLITSHLPQKNGYVLMGYGSKKAYAHRIALAAKLGEEIPKGLDASHTCETVNERVSRRCVNPEHLLAETRSENIRRSKTISNHPTYWYRLGRNVGTAQAGVVITNG